jgi:hypothetical protein
MFDVLYPGSGSPLGEVPFRFREGDLLQLNPLTQDLRDPFLDIRRSMQMRQECRTSSQLGGDFQSRALRTAHFDGLLPSGVVLSLRDDDLVDLVLSERWLRFLSLVLRRRPFKVVPIIWYRSEKPLFRLTWKSEKKHSTASSNVTR